MNKIVCPHCAKDIDLEVKPITSGHTMTTTPPKIDVKINLVTTEQAKTMRNGIDIQGVIVDKGDTRTVTKKAGGEIDICDAWLKDDKGELKLNIWGDDIALIHNGTKVRFTNGYTNTFNGEVSLVKGKYGQMEILS